MQILVLGGTGFIGTRLVRRLVADGHSIALFHRGQTQTDLPSKVVSILGDRNNLAASAKAFERLAPQVVIDMIAYTEHNGLELMQAFRGVAQRVVVLSSMDVYRSYGRLLGLEQGASDCTPATEDAPLRQKLFPYRAQAKCEEDLLCRYEKILVEQAVTGDRRLPATLLRLPAVYGPGDKHRTFEYVKRMDDRRPAILLDKVRARWRWSRGYVENVAAAIGLAATNERATGRIYNVGEGEARTEMEWVQSIGQAAGWYGKIILLPRERLPEHLRSPHDWTHDCVGDSSRIRAELGYDEPVSLEQALPTTVAWERANPPEHVDPKQFDYTAEDAAI